VCPCRQHNFSIIDLHFSLPVDVSPEEQPKKERLLALGCATAVRNMAYRAYAPLSIIALIQLLIFDFDFDI